MDEATQEKPIHGWVFGSKIEIRHGVVQRELNMEYAFYGIHTLLRTESTRRNITRYSILLLVIGLITYMSHFSRAGLGVLEGFFFFSWGILCWWLHNTVDIVVGIASSKHRSGPVDVVFYPVHCSLHGPYYWATWWLLVVSSMLRNASVFAIAFQFSKRTGVIWS